MNILLVAGARPNFIKIAPIIKAIKLKGSGLNYKLVHTGQHYDHLMSQTFFEELNIPKPDVNLACGGGTQSEQTASIMVAFEKYLSNSHVDLVIVVGDVNSTMACTIVAKKNGIKVAHVEAGIRSGDISMPEEINRIVTDSLCDLYFTTSKGASDNLIKTGVEKGKIYFVGNVMIDTLHSNSKLFKKPTFWDNYELEDNNYFVLTLHRPSNVDEYVKINELINIIENSVNSHKVIFPVHPRTRKVLNEISIKLKNIIPVEPLGYLEFNYLVKNAKGIITDSGGITEEATVMGIPCLTLRENTERPETVDIGTNELVGTNAIKIKRALEAVLNDKWKEGSIPEKWDGKASERIVEVLNRYTI